MAHAPLVPGAMLLRSGFFTHARVARGVTPAELENRLGYRAGRLSQGWTLLFMLVKPTPQEFEVAGYTHLPGGVVSYVGGIPVTAEQSLSSGGYDMERIKKNLINDVFMLQGFMRLAKVVPVRGEFGENDYPHVSGVPQWKLKPLARKPFRVAAVVQPGERYMGNYH
jgi:hypothetical protein